MMPPETWAMPLVITTISSDLVSLFKKGRMVRGASVWPMKILAATLSDSAPLSAHERGVTKPGGDSNDELHDTDVIEQRKKSSDENNRGQNLEGKKKVFWGSGETGSGSRGQAEFATKTNCEP